MKGTLQLLLMALLPAVATAQEKPLYSWNNLPTIQAPVFKTDTFNIVKYGAVSDGITLNTESIRKAISDCHRNGGGVVLIPAGLWLTGPVEMKSNVNLHVQHGAILLFTADKREYEIVAGYYEGKAAARNQSPIWGNNLENIGITGRGVIDGNGDSWRALNRTAVTDAQWKDRVKAGGVVSDDGKVLYPSQQYKDAITNSKSMLLTGGKTLKDFEDVKDFLRPNLVAFGGCKRVLLEGVVFQNSAAWCLHPMLCEDLTIRNVTTKNPEYAQNGDGMDIESCKNFLVEGCTLDVGDDAICIKSGKDEEGRKRGKPTENGIIRNNIAYKGHGGFVIGSEMSGGARYIFVENCNFMGTDKGLRFKSVRGRGGVVEHIYARNIFMKDIVDEAIFFDMYYFVKFATDGERDMSPVVSEGTPIFRHMVFEHIVCNGARKSIFIRGLPEMPISNIRIRNSVFTTEKGAEFIDAQGITLDKVQLHTQDNGAVISIENSMNLSFKNVNCIASKPVLVQVKGKRSKAILLAEMGIRKGSDKVTIEKGVAANAITIK